MEVDGATRKGWIRGMARALRIGVVNGWYHVTNRGLERRAVFVDERCYEHFVELIGEGVENFNMRVHAYVFMPTTFIWWCRRPKRI